MRTLLLLIAMLSLTTPAGAGPTPPARPQFLRPGEVAREMAELILHPAKAAGGREVLVRATVTDDPARVEGRYCRLALIERTGADESILQSWTQEATHAPSLTLIAGDDGRYLAVSTIAFEGMTELTLFTVTPDSRELEMLYRWGGHQGSIWICPKQWDGDPVVLLRKAMHKLDAADFRWDREKLMLLRFGKQLSFRYPIGTIGELYPTDARSNTLPEVELAKHCCTQLIKTPTPRAFKDWYPILPANSEDQADELAPQELSENPLNWIPEG